MTRERVRGCSNDGSTRARLPFPHLRQHGLVAAVRVHVDRGHEAVLAGMGVDPPQHDEPLRLAVEVELLLVRGRHRVARPLLLGDDERRAPHLALVLHARQHAARLDAVRELVD